MKYAVKRTGFYTKWFYIHQILEVEAESPEQAEEIAQELDERVRILEDDSYDDEPGCPEETVEVLGTTEEYYHRKQLSLSAEQNSIDFDEKPQLGLMKGKTLDG